MFLEACLFLLCIIVVLCLGLIIYARWNYGTLEKMGIPVVKPHFLLGSTYDLFRIPAPEQDVQWMEKYGSYFGVYEGRDPQIFVCDPELIRLITIKDAQYFDMKRKLEFNDPVLNEMPDFLLGEKWRLVRSCATPAFSSSKLKLMNMPIIESTKDFIKDLKSQMSVTDSGKCVQKVPIDDALCTMLTDLVFRSYFSIEIADLFNRDNPYQKLLREFMDPPALKWPKIIPITFSFPFLLKYIPCTMMNPSAGNEFVRVFKDIMNERRKSGVKRNDVVDLLIEWQDKLACDEMKKFNIIDETIMCEAQIFFWVGQDQISTILGMLCYHLAKHPEIDAKLHEEISTVFAKHNGVVEHDQLKEMPYLLACIYEASRLNPFFYRAERVCTKPWKNEKYNLSIPKGMTIQIPIWAANRHPDYFPDPETFSPERFLSENNEKLHYALSTFGQGPRNCPGKQFSMECMQLVGAYLLKDLTFELREDSELKFKNVGPWMFAPHEFIYLNVKERDSK